MPWNFHPVVSWKNVNLQRTELEIITIPPDVLLLTSLSSFYIQCLFSMKDRLVICSIGFFERARSGYEHGTSFKCSPLSFRLLIEREDNFHKLQTF